MTIDTARCEGTRRILHQDGLVFFTRNCPGCPDCTEPAPSAGVSDPTDTLEFYDLMQAYRHAPIVDQMAVCAAYEAVREFIRALLPKEST